MNLKNRRVEVLAPAGSFEIMKAVINAGADAVYLGGQMFGARAYAGNLTQEEIILAIEYAHLRNASIYLTVNTLVKEQELEDYLIDYLKPLYEAGLDAVIVQDLGVFKVVHDNFPDMHIHASTQMTSTGHMGAQLLEKMGASRVVTSRELSLIDIKGIHDNCSVEIESFVHGALCYSYSGQCLLSSMNGDRSGNRGRCAQPCRLAYDAFDENMNKLNDDNSKYVLSPKDICTLRILPEIVEAGVFSLKIEGRMKNVSYAAGVTSIFRKYVDMYLKNGKSGYKVDKQDINDLMDLYNRGAFTTGYYNNTKGRDMLSLYRPNHCGTAALKVLENNSGRVVFKALEQINPHDVFEIDKDNSFSSGESVRIGDTFVVNLPRKYKINKGQQLCRTRSGKITENIQKMYVDSEMKVPVNISFTAKLNEPALMHMYGDEISVVVSGGVVQKAMKQPVSADEIKKRVCKLGETCFFAENIEVSCDDDLFIPAGELNAMRRESVEKYINAILNLKRRTFNVKVNDIQILSDDKECKKYKSVLVSNVEQLEYIKGRIDIERVYVEYTLVDEYEIKELTCSCHAAGKQIFIAFPHILRESKHEIFNKYFTLPGIGDVDGYLVRNIESLCILSKNIHGAHVVFDAGIYTFNSMAKACLYDICSKLNVKFENVTIPLELSFFEISKMNNDDAEIVVYSRYPLMISEQCVRKTFAKCDGKNNSVFLTMAKFDKKYRVDSRCKYCYTILYDTQPVVLYDLNEVSKDLAPCGVRYEFTGESIEEIAAILDGRIFDNKINRGHFFTGLK